MTAVDGNPYSAYTEEATRYEAAYDDLGEVLPRFASGLLAMAGRLLAALTYRDVLDYGDRPLRRRSAKATRTALALLPRVCDRQNQEFRRSMAACFAALAGDIDAGRAPVPRCTAEREALGVMIDCAPRLLAFSDAELGDLGIDIGAVTRKPDVQRCVLDDETLWTAFVTVDAERSIPEAQPHRPGGEPPAPPRSGWAAVEYWFSPYGITLAREPRPHPDWVTAALAGETTTAADPEPGRLAEAARLLGLDNPVDPWAAYTDDDPATDRHGALGAILTHQGARLLAAAAADLAGRGHHELLSLGDQPYERNDGAEFLPGDTFFGLLPPVCDRQSVAWRLAMVRAVLDLRDDLVSGAAPLPRCTAEEVALHLILLQARHLLDQIEDENVAAAYGLPGRETYTARHTRFEMMRAAFFQDEDFLLCYDLRTTDLADDSDQFALAMDLLTSDLRPPDWWSTFENLKPRDATRGFPAWILQQLTASSPFLAAQHTVADEPRAAASSASEETLPTGLAAEFERFVGLTQRRFFDLPCAVAMARSLERVLTGVLACPRLSLGRVWPDGHAISGDETLVVDDEFVLAGSKSMWRLHADLVDSTARAWVLDLIADCAVQVFAHYARAEPELLIELALFSPPDIASLGLPKSVLARLDALAQATTLAGFLRYRRDELGLSQRQLAEAAVVPESIVVSWEAGATAAPSQVSRCAPALQLPEFDLVAALRGIRNPDYWPLPTPAAIVTRGRR